MAKFLGISALLGGSIIAACALASSAATSHHEPKLDTASVIVEIQKPVDIRGTITASKSPEDLFQENAANAKRSRTDDANLRYIEVSAWAAVAAAVVGFLTAAVLVWQVTLLRNQVREMSRATDVSKTSADAASRSARIAESALIAAHRPWVVVKVEPAGPIGWIADTHLEVPLKYTVKNIGKSPALDLQRIQSIELKYTTDVNARYEEYLAWALPLSRVKPGMHHREAHISRRSL